MVSSFPDSFLGSQAISEPYGNPGTRGARFPVPGGPYRDHPGNRTRDTARGPEPERTDSEWEAVQARARVLVARLRSLPRTDPWAQVWAGTWPIPTEEQRRQGRLVEEVSR
jgi:hypothetical protein